MFLSLTLANYGAACGLSFVRDPLVQVQHLLRDIPSMDRWDAVDMPAAIVSGSDREELL